MFERSTSSILKHTQAQSDLGEKLSLSISTWNTDNFDNAYKVEDVLLEIERNLKPIDMAQAS